MKAIYLIFATFIFLSSCKKNQDDVSSNNILLDSIKRPKNITIRQNCLHKTKGYYKRFGLLISNFYKPIRTTSIDFNNDGEIDTIAIMKPFYMRQIEYKCFSSKTKIDNILVFAKTIKNNSIFFKKYSQVISLKDEFLGAEEVETLKSGFLIYGDWGHSNKLYSSVYVDYKNNDFYIDSLKIESWGMHQYNKIYRYDNLSFPLSKYKREIIDSLQSVNDKI